ncbi:MAG TPA: serine/threonine-protein kinase [Steroidobacteraceae bacterium]|nr:serine/threonine-protein kinase [Steroidobacteraceae bacterium]
MKSSSESRTGPLAEQSRPNDARSGSPGEQLTRLGSYLLLGVISQGSMATVYRSSDPGTGRAVAIKAVRRDPAPQNAGENLAARLRVEAEVASRLSHPGIVAVREYGEDALHAFIVMEYVDGVSLRQCFERRMSFGASRSISLVSQVLGALQYAHERGVWHRDIKPANILVREDDLVKVTDFGIAQLAAPMAQQMDVILGSPGYIAPESYLGEKFDERADVFATGAVLYELLAGVPAFAGTADQIMFKVCNEAPLGPSIVAGMSSLQPYDELVLKALARRPEDRFASAAQFRQALLGVAQNRRSGC